MTHTHKTALAAAFIGGWAILDDAILTRWHGFASVILATAAALAVIALVTRKQPDLLPPVLLVAGAMSLSWIANADLEPAIVQFIYLAAGIGGMYAAAWLGRDVVRDALFWAGWVWLAGVAAAWLAGIHINRNIIGFWPVLWIVAVLAAPHRLNRWVRLAMVAVWLGVILWADSRGGLLAAVTALLVYYPPKKRRVAVGAGLAGLAVLLVGMNFTKSVYRIYYWKAALETMRDHNPLFGLGPGGILARGVIPEPGQHWNAPHAHNILIHHTAELGIVGGAALLAGLAWTCARREWFQTWQLAALAGVLAHSMVDHPTFYFSPLLVVLMIAGSVKNDDGEEVNDAD